MIRCCCGLAGSFRWRGPLSWNKGQLTDESADTNETNAVSVSGATQSRNVARWPSMLCATERDRPSPPLLLLLLLQTFLSTHLY